MNISRRTILLLGSTGLLGQAVAHEAQARGNAVLGAARHDAPLQVDIADDHALSEQLQLSAPDMVINCAALTSIDACQETPALAWRTNCHPLSVLADWSRAQAKPLIHVSTDHFFDGGGAAAHDETVPVVLVNEYARTKYAAERLALRADRSLVLRTAIVGIRGWQALTFAEWAIDVVTNNKPATLFDDTYTSAIDVTSFARIMFDLIDAGATGLLHLAASEVYSKAAFVREIARQLGCPISAQTTGSSRFATPRAHALGLDVRRAEAILGYRFPTLTQVVTSLLRQYRG